jgi:DNA primase
MSNWVDFAAIKRSVPLAPLLQRYRVQLRRSGCDQYRGPCPIHRGEGQEAFHANLSQNIFHCFSCGAGGSVLDFVAAMEGCSLREAALHLQQQICILGQPAAARQDGKQLVTKKRSTPTALGFTLHGVDCTHAYLAARGIERRTAEQFGVGSYRGPGIFSGRLVIPIHNQRGELVGYCGRALDHSEPRYRFPPGLAKSEILFNCHRAAAAAKFAVVVVEGFFDCFKLHQAGVHAVVALMGSALYESQQRLLLERFQHVILMLDGDAAGRRATAAIATRLRSQCSLQVLDLAPQTQPDQMSSEQIRHVLRTCHDRSPANLTGPLH